MSTTSELATQTTPQVPLGLEIHRTILNDDDGITGDTMDTHDNFYASIMHQVVSTKLFSSTVVVDVDVCTVAGDLGMDVGVLEESLYGRKVSGGGGCCGVGVLKREKEMGSVEDVVEIVDDEFKGDDRFKELFVKKKKVDEGVREFAEMLMVRLEGLESREGREVGKRRRVGSGGAVADLVSARSVECEEENRCGFSSCGHHEDVQVLCDGFAVVKSGKGLYRSARAAYGLSSLGHKGKDGEYSYFEVYVVEDCGKDGMCIGVATDDLQLNKLVGSNTSSVGLHSTGSIVADNGAFEPYGEGFKAGDRVGCLARRFGGDLPPNSTITSFPSSLSVSCANLDISAFDADHGVELTFFVNGRPQPTILKAIKSGDSSNTKELFPTISLYQKESKAVLCCCPDDWKHAPQAVKNNEGKCSGSSSCVYADTTTSLCSV
eukprot:Plantae.Rhodophyta-Hildenbrandia_rubra.ctg3406.p1 GENE.Plantae.Rhodophyta-Hildenbrandia_rubra.ctg3406~~Plantae.Rhodophyta-Hildenbrandia_rubra.ctg3406.p1  ORF type:complete len:434 (-),score=107.39 Plantae.Rhodophyta-Hildenbrandia_rubra.ctg3406:2058-3359(-)